MDGLQRLTSSRDATAPGAGVPGPEQVSGLSAVPEGYKWIALFISTLGMLMATIDSSIVLIALPDVFRGIGIDPLEPGNTFYLLWMILGFLVVTSVLVVSLGRMGDIYGRVRTYNLGFAVFTFFSLMLSITWMTGHAAGIYLIVMRIFQGVGAAMLMANSAAILTDVFPDNQRGLALGINQAAAFSGSFIGLVLGGVLAPINWRLIFLVSVPIGLFATIFGYLRLREVSPRRPARIDWPGNITFAVGLVLVMIGITYGIEPYGHKTMGWTNPMVLGSLALGVAFLVVFCIIETKVPQPMFRLQLFKIRAFTSGVLASFLAALSRGGLMFMLIIWLQGIWLPLHGYAFSITPLWAGIAMLPLTLGFLVAGHRSGDQEPEGKREHGDARPQGGDAEGVAVQRQPDPLEPDDEHEHQPVTAESGQEAGQYPAGEGPDLEQLQPEHGLGDLGLDDAEHDEERDPEGQRAQDHGIGPSHGLVAVGLDPVGDADHDQDQADCEGDVAGPVDPCRAARGALPQPEIAEDGGEQPDGNRHQEDQPPVDRRQDATEDQADERPAEGGRLVDPECQPPLIVGEHVGQDGRRVGHQHGGAHSLEDAHDDQIDAGGVAGHPGDAEHQREEGEHGEAEVVGAHPTVDVAHPAEAHHQDAGDHQEAQDHPEQVEGVAGLERVDADAAEDVRKGDQHDGAVDGGHQHAEGGDEQRDPLVALGYGRQAAHLLGAGYACTRGGGVPR